MISSTADAAPCADHRSNRLGEEVALVEQRDDHRDLGRRTTAHAGVEIDVGRGRMPCSSRLASARSIARVWSHLARCSAPFNVRWPPCAAPPSRLRAGDDGRSARRAESATRRHRHRRRPPCGSVPGRRPRIDAAASAAAHEVSLVELVAQRVVRRVGHAGAARLVEGQRDGLLGEMLERRHQEVLAGHQRLDADRRLAGDDAAVGDRLDDTGPLEVGLVAAVNVEQDPGVGKRGELGVAGCERRAFAEDRPVPAEEPQVGSATPTASRRRRR